MPGPLADRVALVTGASSGIGKAIALHLADLGAAVIVNYRASAEAADAVATEIRRGGHRAMAHRADVTDPEAIETMLQAAAAELGPVDVLVNNVGGPIAPGPFTDLDPDLWDRVFALTLKSAYMCTRAVVPAMQVLRRGWIVNISSIAAETGAPGGSIAYAAAKGAMNTMTLGLARELAPFNIRVNAVAPGLIATPFHAGNERSLPQRVAAIPMGRIGEPEEVARMVGFLVGERATDITGQVWTVAGGR